MPRKYHSDVMLFARHYSSDVQNYHVTIVYISDVQIVSRH